MMAKNNSKKDPKSSKAKRKELRQAKRARKARKESPQLSYWERRWQAESIEDQRVKQSLSSSRKLTRNVADSIQKIFNGEFTRDQLRRFRRELPQTHCIVGIISLYLNSPARAAGPALQSLLLALATTKSKILSDNTYLNALPEIVKYRQSWLNQPQTWRPQKKNVRKQFASLLRHLLAKYPVPLFMDSAWVNQPLYPRFQKWWIHIAQGGSLRKRDDLPFKPFTKKIAHHFLQAPHSFSICEALRWGQIHALGGNERIARGICTTFLARDYTTFNRNTFWESVLRFFIANPMLDTQQYGPVCDYLNNQKFVTPYGAEGPPQPNLSMKDRQADALVRQVETWHAQLGRFEKFSRCPPNWNHHPNIKDWEYRQKSEKNPKLYRIIQLLSRAELKEEGRRLDHCVYSYGYSCASGRTSIWSLQEIFPNNSIDHLGTIEVANAESRIVQFRAKYNREPKPKAKTLLKRWASENGLSLARWL